MPTLVRGGLPEAGSHPSRTELIAPASYPAEAYRGAGIFRFRFWECTAISAAAARKERQTGTAGQPSPAPAAPATS